MNNPKLYPADLSVTADVDRAVKQINNQFGKVNVLINNAGGVTNLGGGYSTLTDQNWEDTLQLNLLASVRLDRALLPQMLQQQFGIIIHIYSTTALFHFGRAICPMELQRLRSIHIIANH